MKAALFNVVVFPAGGGDTATLYPVRTYKVVGTKGQAILNACAAYKADGNAPASVTLDWQVTPVAEQVEIGASVEATRPKVLATKVRKGRKGGRK